MNWTLACETPTNDAFLAILPELSDDDLRSTSPVKLLPTYGAPSGTVSFWMPNLRVPYVVGLYRGGLDSPSTSPPLATSPPVTWAQPNEPTGVHISLFGPGALTISWTTVRPLFLVSASSLSHTLTLTQHNETAPVVFWRRQTPGQDPVQELFNASASIAVLTRASFFGDADVNWRPSRPMELSSNATKLGWLPPGTQHSAVLTNLSPGAYDYAVGTAADAAGRRLDRGFVMPPTSGPFSFLVVADMGVEEIDGASLRLRCTLMTQGASDYNKCDCVVLSSLNSCTQDRIGISLALSRRTRSCRCAAGTTSRRATRAPACKRSWPPELASSSSTVTCRTRAASQPCGSPSWHCTSPGPRACR